MKISEISDSSGYVRFILSSFVLFVNHGLRDYLITALPSITLNHTNGNLEREINIFINTIRSLSVHSSNYSKLSTGDTNTEKGWTSALIGGTLSSVHWGWLVPVIVAPLIVHRLPIKYLLVSSLLTSGTVALFTELVAEGSASGVLILRAAQGFLQGWCYPIVFFILEDLESSSFILPYFFIFLAPWFGSALGALMGWAQNPFTGGYVFGSLSILIGVLTLFVPLSRTNSEEKPQHAWRECLTSSAVWACILLQMGIVWCLHLFLIGLSFTLEFKLNRSELVWTVFVIILAAGVITRLVAMVAMNLMRNHFLSPLNRRRFIILTGSLVIIISLITNGVMGINSKFVLLGMTMLGVGAGVSICLVGIRLNLHDLGPLFPTPFLILGSIGATVGAGTASLLFPILSQVCNIAQITNGDDGPWRIAWMVPVVVVVAVCCIHLFLVSVIPLPHQTFITNKTTPIQCNGAAANMDEIDAKSFKSLKSALSFKSAVSKQRARTVSFKTIDDNIEAEFQNFPESDGEECVSAVQDDDDENQEMKSVKSGTSFKSTMETRSTSQNGNEYGVVLSVQELDRTAVWLTTHHHTGMKLHHQTSSEKIKVERNILFALQW